MKKQIIYIGTYLLLTGSINSSYANKETIGTNVATQSTAQKIQEQTIKLDIYKIENKGDKKLVQIKLTSVKDNKPVTLQDLKEIHTQKIHLLIIDDELEDYSHKHPKALKEPGLYEFEWSPKKKQGTYRIWADLFPLNTNSQEYVIADLLSDKDKASKINRNMLISSTLDGYKFELSFDTDPLMAGSPTMGKIIVTDSKGNSVNDLEPIMGTFAHIVGFYDDIKTVVHIHPMGKEPLKSTDRSGPEVEFHIEPAKSGFVKLFAQVKIHGKELFVPFGIIIK